MTSALFLRLFNEQDRGPALRRLISSVRNGSTSADTLRVDPASFDDFPGSAFGYWATDRVREVFRTFPQFESEGRIAKVGLQTSDDFRFVRTAWEVDRAAIGGKGPWFPFAKGGSYSPYYADLHLVVNEPRP